MTISTGRLGALRFNGTRICRIRNWTLNISKDALDVTCLGSDDREYVEGLRGATGSAQLIYDSDNADSRALMQRILTSDSELPSDSITFSLLDNSNRGFTANVIITGVNASMSTTDVTVADITFQISGPITGNI